MPYKSISPQRLFARVHRFLASHSLAPRRYLELPHSYIILQDTHDTTELEDIAYTSLSAPPHYLQWTSGEKYHK
jgi:hypothetical protein